MARPARRDPSLLPDEQLGEGELLEALTAGDPAAFALFFEAWFPRVYAYALLQAPDRAHAEAATERALGRAIEELAEGAFPSRVAPWLLSHVRHALAQHAPQS